LNNIRFWVAKNKANEKHYYDGKYWTYNSVKAFSELFPYWSKDQIRRYIDKLETAGEIVSGNYNQSHYDRTKWYSLNCQIELANLPNENGENAKPIPYIKTYNKTDNIEERKLKFANTLKPFIDIYGKDLLKDFYSYWTEPNKSNTKFKQELQKTWSAERRLENWAKNDKNFNNNFNHKQQQQNELTRIANEIRNGQYQ
jgi:hypothetical protein